MGVHATAAARPTSQSMVGCLSPPLPPPLQAVPRQSRPHAALRHRRRGIAAELVAAAGDGGIGKEGGAAGAAPAAFGRQRHLPAMLRPLSDPIANRKLLALSLAQCLSSIATLLHDTFLPLYMSEVLGMSNTTMGNLHGLLQLLARASGVIAGRLADIFGPARMVILGVGLTALVCKPMFALCGTVYTLAGAAACVTLITYAKMADRFVKGVRETPSKALVGDLAAESGDSAAAAFSVRQALSTFGMLVGSGAAAAVFKLTNRSYEATFALSVIPAALGLLLVATALGGDARATHHHAAHLASLDEGEDLSLLAKARMLAGALPSGYYQALAVMSVLYMARFDVAFITVHASAVMDTASLPLLTLCSMLPVVLLAAPMGLRAKTSVAARNTVLVCGIAMLGVGDLCYAFLPSVLGMVLGSTCVGLHMAMTQGVLFGMLASYIPSQALPGLGKISGTIWSFTDLLLGCALAYSNSLAGRLCDVTALRGMGNTGCFLGGAVISAASILVLLAFTSFGALGQEEAAAAAAA